jgi:type II secretory pathway pseudopilin PulG
MKDLKMTISQKRKQLGAFSIELGLVLLVVLGIIAAAVWWYRDNIRKTSINDNTSQLLHISSNMISKYGKPGRYADVTTAIAVQAGVIPANLRDGAGNTATNLFGGDVTVAPQTLTGANDSMLLTWPAVPRNQCSDIVSGVAGEFRRIDVGATTVKPDNADLDIADLETACDSADVQDLALSIGRF